MTIKTTTTTVHATLGDVPVTYTEQGGGHTFLVLHGGAGSRSVSAFTALLAGTRPAHVIAPTNPGFDGTRRPVTMTNVGDVAAVHLALLDTLDVHDVTIVGNSLGGWAAAEMALAKSPRVSSVVLVNAVGLISDTDPTKDFFALTMDEVTDISYYNPDKYRIDTAALPPAIQRNMAQNRSTMLAIAGPQMGDPTLHERLTEIAVPVLVVWGAADGMVPLSHGQMYRDAIPGARLDIIHDAGHLPQIETPERLVDDVWDFAAQHATLGPQSRPERK